MVNKEWNLLRIYCKPRPNYAKIAEIFDGYSETVENPQMVKSALIRALEEVKNGRCAILDVILK